MVRIFTVILLLISCIILNGQCSDDYIEPNCTFRYFGDSVIDGQAASTQQEQWIYQLANDYGANVIKEAFDGAVLIDTTINGSTFGLSGNTQIIPNKSESCERAIIGIGVNDIKYLNWSAQYFNFHYRIVLDDLISKGWHPQEITLLNLYNVRDCMYSNFVGPQYGTGTNTLNRAKHEAFNQLVLELANEYNTRYADVYSAMAIPNVNTNVSADCIHPNDAGHDIITDVVSDAIIEIRTLHNRGICLD